MLSPSDENLHASRPRRSVKVDRIIIPRSESLGSLILDDGVDETIPLSPSGFNDIFTSTTQSQTSRYNRNIFVDVVIPYLQTSMMGSILLIRLPWITGEGGILLALVICVVTVISTTLTSLSLGAIGTDGRIDLSSNLYFLLRKNLGRELASGLCMVFYAGKVLTVSMYCLAASETAGWKSLHDTSADHMPDSWYNQLMAIVFCVALTVSIGIVPRNLLSSISYITFIIGLLSTLSVIIGVITCSTHRSCTVVNHPSSQSIVSHFTRETNFYVLLGIFYPSFTGIMANTVSAQDQPHRRLPSPVGNIWGVLTLAVMSVLIIVLFGLIVPHSDLLNNKLVAGKIVDVIS